MNSPEYAFTNMTSLNSGKIAFVFFFNHPPFCVLFRKANPFHPQCFLGFNGTGAKWVEGELTYNINREIVNSRWPTRSRTKITIGRKEKKEDKTAVMKILMKIHIQRMMQIHQMKALTRIWLAFILVLIISFCVALALQPLKKQKTRDCMICTVSWSFDRRFLLNLKPFRRQKKISMGYDVFCNRWDELFL